MTTRTALSFAALLLPFHLSHAESPESQLADAHGLAAWESVESIEFTFYVDKEPPVNRAWRWDLNEKTATRTIDGASHTLQLDTLDGEKDAEIHQQFINDTFWLLFPFSIVWSSPEVTEHGSVEIIIEDSTVETQQLTVTWPSDEGYTPGDAYDLYLADDNTILGWTFRRANAPEGKFFRWSAPTQLGPLTVYPSYYLGDSTTPFIEMRDLDITL